MGPPIAHPSLIRKGRYLGRSKPLSLFLPLPTSSMYPKPLRGKGANYYVERGSCVGRSDTWYQSGLLGNTSACFSGDLSGLVA